ncbi:radical SAM protein [Pseudoalteromonas denitrificans]|uniref:Radical SAM core domain-containing protein n=1 Tax=Pseudoalteromonas denitrificans DSM 6059 TaxID=1123010 RepID=A0A1I1JK92_9GAMM|nr:radical SAM protein [Pseudoalteromonas denitrificans]SFC48765.1 uncharacterized protein SAMN02745724_01782 [Pseudoalteromonas denitrificans DSM 6059]
MDIYKPLKVNELIQNRKVQFLKDLVIKPEELSAPDNKISLADIEMSKYQKQQFDDTFKKKYIKASSDGFLFLTIMPTEKCNFRCVYCYEDFQIGKMDVKTVHAIKNLLSHSAPTLKNLVITWFGGEPTLNTAAVFDISEHILLLQSEFGFKYSANMTTNGYLLDLTMLEQLVKFGVSEFQISLDGDRILHDSTRVQLSGKGSFNQIWSNLLAFSHSNLSFHIQLRIHITEKNLSSVILLGKKIKSNFALDKRFSVILKNISDFGTGHNSGNVKALVPINLKQKLEQLKTIYRDLTNTPNIKDIYICYASMPRHVVIRADGSLSKCTVKLHEDDNKIGKICDDGRLQVDDNKFSFWTEGFEEINLSKLACPAQNLKSNLKSISDIPIITTFD